MRRERGEGNNWRKKFCSKRRDFVEEKVIRKITSFDERKRRKKFLEKMFSS